MSAWGHRLETITLERLIGAPLFKPLPGQPPFYSSPTCSRKACPNPPLWIASYDYVTGRQGRTSSAERRLCEKHATDFAKKYKLNLPASSMTVEDLAEWRRRSEAYDTFWREWGASRSAPPEEGNR